MELETGRCAWQLLTNYRLERRILLERLRALACQFFCCDCTILSCEGKSHNICAKTPSYILPFSMVYKAPEIVGANITVDNKTTRTLSEPDGIRSSGIGQHPATALAPPLAV
jgi:hypothetical protein